MSSSDSWITALHAQHRLADLDLHFARFLLDKAEQPSEALGLAAALVCQATAEGHVCLDLRQIAGLPLQPDDEPAPELKIWRQSLLDSGVVGGAEEYQPLILDRADRLYLHRYWDYEQRLAKQLQQRAMYRINKLDGERLKQRLEELFNDPPPSGVDWQKLAAATAMRRKLAVISGGPGTGKTTTVTKILVLLRQQPGGEKLRIALAAPTGKAASRMQEAVRQAKARLSLPTDLAKIIPEQAKTLHRLLEVRYGQAGFVHNADNPLPLDVLILDEASMIDVALMAKLMDAMPATARLVLLGDKDQLASVEAGAVLGDICTGCEDQAVEAAAEFQEATGETTGQGGICDAIVVLRHSYRFGAQSPIGRLARAVNEGDAQAALVMLMSSDEAGAVTHLSPEQDVALIAARRYRAFFHAVESGVAVYDLFKAIDRFRVLCALRQGPMGAVQLNRRITEHLGQAEVNAEAEWFPGRPVMVTRNDYQQKLYNGDLGICLPHPQNPGELAVAFEGEDQTVRWLAASRLPPHETVFAMTVHKSQGSEFDEVLLCLPALDAPLLSRELLYTAITRVRQRFVLAGPLAVFEQAVKRRLKRNSGLADLLHDTDLF